MTEPPRRRRRWSALLVPGAGLVLAASALLIIPSSCNATPSAAAAGGVQAATSAVPPSDQVATASPTASSANEGLTSSSPAPSITVSEAVLQGVVYAQSQGVDQSVAVVDRLSGQLVADVGGGNPYNAESMTKLFTAAYYLATTDGDPGPDLTSQLRAMIADSDDSVQTDLWTYDIIQVIADRYGLTGSWSSGSPESWGSDQITATDIAMLLYASSTDPLVGPQLVQWMRETTDTGLDGFDQAFGFNVLPGDSGSKQAWSDPGWWLPNLHSAGWTPRYFAAILQSAPTEDYDTLRATSTRTAQLLLAASR